MNPPQRPLVATSEADPQALLTMLSPALQLTRQTLPFQTEYHIFLGFLAVWVVTIILFNLNNNPYKLIRVGQTSVTFAWIIFLGALYTCYILYHIMLEVNMYKELTKKWEKELLAQEDETYNVNA